MSSNPPAPTASPSTDAPFAAPRAPRPPAPFSLSRWIRDLNPFAKAAIVAVLLLLLVAWYVFTGRVTTDDAQVDCHITAMAPQVPGYVVNLLINDNTPVKEGDLLVQIDPREYEAEVAQAKANLEFAEAQANSAEIQIGLTRATTTQSTSGAVHQTIYFPEAKAFHICHPPLPEQQRIVGDAVGQIWRRFTRPQQRGYG